MFFVRGRNQIFTFCLDKFYHHSQSDAPVPSRNKGSVFFHEFPFSLLFFGHLLYLLLSIPMSQFQSTFIRKMGGGGQFVDPYNNTMFFPASPPPAPFHRLYYCSYRSHFSCCRGLLLTKKSVFGVYSGTLERIWRAQNTRQTGITVHKLR